MKIRTDFITNSSSSSFIIGKKDDNITVEMVFNMLKEFYKTYLDSLDKVIKELEKEYGISEYDPYYKMLWSEFNSYTEYQNYLVEIFKKIPSEDGFIDDFVYDISWMDFKSYADYEAHWVEYFKNQTDFEYKMAPFSIVDYTKPYERYRIDAGKCCLREGPSNCKASDSDIFDWYVACGAYFYARDSHSEEFWKSFFMESDSSYACNYCEIGKNHKLCSVYQSLIKDKAISNENAISFILGKVCIHSESNIIPEDIVDMLMNVSILSCSHMG